MYILLAAMSAKVIYLKEGGERGNLVSMGLIEYLIIYSNIFDHKWEESEPKPSRELPKSCWKSITKS